MNWIITVVLQYPLEGVKSLLTNQLPHAVAEYKTDERCVLPSEDTNQKWHW